VGTVVFTAVVAWRGAVVTSPSVVENTRVVVPSVENTRVGMTKVVMTKVVTTVVTSVVYTRKAPVGPK